MRSIPWHRFEHFANFICFLILRRNFQQIPRRSSASDAEISSTTLGGRCNRQYIKRRLKELQKNRLMAVHEALMMVLEEMKASGEVMISNE